MVEIPAAPPQPPRMLVIVPTRGRPDNATRLDRAFFETVGFAPTCDLVFVVDDDDPEMQNYRAQFAGGDRYGELVIGPRLGLVGSLNKIAQERAQDYQIVGFMGDDHLPRTREWDQTIKMAMRPYGVVYANDLLQGPNLPTAVFLDAAIVQKLGYFAPTQFRHLYVDNVWKAWGERLGTLTYLGHVVIEHRHPVAGKAEMDAGYRLVNSGNQYRMDEEAWLDYQRGGLDHDIEHLTRTVPNG